MTPLAALALLLPHLFRVASDTCLASSLVVVVWPPTAHPPKAMSVGGIGPERRPPDFVERLLLGAVAIIKTQVDCGVPANREETGSCGARDQAAVRGTE
jgi:hypothetical protein